MILALLTIWHEKNYGAELQVYATVKILKELGHTVKLIDLRLSDIKEQNFKGKIADFISKYSPENQKFNRFWERIECDKIRYQSVKELQNNPPMADAYIVGSDQVWNPDITKKYANLFFLDFGADIIRRISYASSFGVESWQHNDCTDKVASLLQRFSYLSCRESSGVKILREVFHRQAEHVLDPTLLFSDYSEFVKSLHEQRTLVYYPLSKDTELEDYSLNLALKLGLRAVNNNDKKLLFNKLVWDRIGIEDVYGHSGPAVGLLAEYGLDAAGLENRIRALVK